MAKLKLPFELEKPSANEYVTQSSQIGHNGEPLDQALGDLSKFDNISKQSTESEEEAIIYETDGGVQIGKIDSTGADFANLKRGGQQVARMSDLPTKDSSIGDSPSTTHVPTTKAVKDYVDANAMGDLPISKESTQSEDEELVASNDAGTDTYAKVGFYGVKAKAYKKLNGDDAFPQLDTTIADVPSQTNVPTSKAVVDYIDEHFPVEQGTGADIENVELLDDNNQIIFAITQEGIKAKKYMNLEGGSAFDDLSGKTIMVIGDSVTASGRTDTPDTSFASFLSKETGATVINHSKGGIGIVEMVDGSSYDPDAEYDPDDYGVRYLPPLSAEEVANCDYIIAVGFFNAVNKYEANEPYNYGTVNDVYTQGQTNSVCAQLNHLIDRIYECLTSANNDKCKLVFATPYKCGHYPYSNGDGYSTYCNFAEYVRKIAINHSIPIFDLMEELGMNQYTWGIYTNSLTVINSKYVPYVNGYEGNSPHPTIADLPTASVANNSYATVGTTAQWDVYKYTSGEWKVMQTGCTPTREFTSIPSGGSHVGGYIWFADQLHPSLECRKQISKFFAAKLKTI